MWFESRKIRKLETENEYLEAEMHKLQDNVRYWIDCFHSERETRKRLEAELTRLHKCPFFR